MNWDEYFLKLCAVVSEKSKDPSTKTGCVIVSKEHRVLSTGYNGFPCGVIDDPRFVAERYERPEKYSWMEHCDRNAIYSAARAGVSLAGSTMYLTGPPCHECARGIIQAGIVEVVFPAQNDFQESARAERWRDSFKIMETMFREAFVKVRSV